MMHRTNTVVYSPGHAPIGELRDGRAEQPVHRYGRKRPTSNSAKLMMMRKCKR